MDKIKNKISQQKVETQKVPIFDRSLKTPSQGMRALWLPLCLSLLSVGSATLCSAQPLPRSLAFLDACGGGDDTTSNTGPVRMARFSYLKGDVTWRLSADADWTPASNNMPLRQGAQLWVADNSNAEIQFDDGSRMRLDSNTLVTLQTLYSDTDGEFTEVTLNDGQVYLRLNNKYSLYQVNTPEASVKAAGPGRLRVGSGEGAQFAVRSGAATVEGKGGSVTLNGGDYLDVEDNNSSYQALPLPASDRWDSWNDNRDRELDGIRNGRQHHVPANIGLVADDLELYGSWHDDARYGWVWAPRVTEADWRPYSSGHWTWVEPFGWTWVANESWGWAPYHYGTWVHQPYGWGWVPGPTTQYWSPAVVSFYQSDSRVAWCPLAPAEVRYPSALSIGFRSGNWSLFFSIGSAAVYYPNQNHICEARPWSTGYVNHVTYVNNVTNVTNVTNVYNNTNIRNISVNRNTYITNNNFVPANAQAQGASVASTQNFGGRGAYAPVTRADYGVFTSGRAVAAPANGQAAIAGPQAVQVTRAALSPTRSFQPTTSVPHQYTTRAIYRAPLPANVPAQASTVQTGQRFENTRAAIAPVRNGNGTAPGTTVVTPTRPGRVTTPNPTPGTPGRPTNPANPNSGNNTVAPGTTRPSSGSTALQQYLRDRDKAKAGNSGANSTSTTNPNAGARPNGTTNPNRDNTNAEGGRPRPGSNAPANPATTGNTPPRTPRDTTTLPPRTSEPPRNTTPVPPRTTAPVAPRTAEPAPQRRAIPTDSYRPLHSGGGSTGSTAPPSRPVREAAPRTTPPPANSDKKAGDKSKG